jgi:hypothetical protein
MTATACGVPACMLRGGGRPTEGSLWLAHPLTQVSTSAGTTECRWCAAHYKEAWRQLRWWWWSPWCWRTVTAATECMHVHPGQCSRVAVVVISVGEGGEPCGEAHACGEGACLLSGACMGAHLVCRGHAGLACKHGGGRTSPPTASALWNTRLCGRPVASLRETKATRMHGRVRGREEQVIAVYRLKWVGSIERITREKTNGAFVVVVVVGTRTRHRMCTTCPPALHRMCRMCIACATSRTSRTNRCEGRRQLLVPLGLALLQHRGLPAGSLYSGAGIRSRPTATQHATASSTVPDPMPPSARVALQEPPSGRHRPGA